MRSGKWLLSSLLALSGVAAAGRAELSEWVQHEPEGRLLQVLLRSVPMPGGPVRFRRPPAETRPVLTAMIAGDAKNAALYRLRAEEDEIQLDFATAEKDWRTYADLAADRGEGYLDLADYYHRRANARGELDALEEAGRAPSDALLPATEQRSWLAFSRMLPVITDAGLPPDSTASAFREWIARYPAEAKPRQEYIDFLIGQRSFAAAAAQIAEYRKAFSADDVYPVEADASLASHRESDEAAIRVYDRAFRPLWPKALTDAYFKLLDDRQELREFEGRARTAVAKDAGDLDATARLVAYSQHENNTLAARRVLLEYRMAKEAKPGSWSAAELRTAAGLFAEVQDANEQARAWYALYSLSGASAGDRETALAGLASLLLDQPGESIRFGSGDLSFYKDIATADDSPGFLNGILSLVLNSTTPRWQYQRENDKSAAYFHRAAGAQLVETLEREFPNSPHRAELRASLVDAYAGYGDDADVITAGRSFLTTFANVPQRTHVALALADALARQHRETEEFAVYQQMLTELAARAGGVPLGVHGGAAQPAANPNGFAMGQRLGAFGPIGAMPRVGQAAEPGPRSPDYATVLDHYLARLAALNRPMDALRVYRDELARDPSDPGLYERFAGFLEQNNIAADVQDIYRRAIGKFPDKSWYHRLARWYLRSRQQSAYTALTREVTGIFSGTELESYFNELVRKDPQAPNLYLQLNLFAHQRFPDDLVFVRNLLGEYRSATNHNPAAATALLHDYWFYDDELKRQYFEQLSQGNQIYSQLAELRRDHPEIAKDQWQQLEAANPAAVQFDAEAETWLGHYEAAAAPLRALADAYPGRQDLNERAASLHRSLAVYFAADTGIAASLVERAWSAAPRDTKLIETIGDIYSDRDRFTQAAAAWNRIPRVFPGKPDGYLEAATVFWDYYRFTDALRLIGEARVRYRDSSLFAYEAGAIWEGRRNYTRAIAEYLAADTDASRGRVVTLARHPAYRDLVYRLTANAYPDVRIAVLETQQRRPELEAYLTRQIALATHASDLAPLLEAAQSQGFDAVEQRGLERQIALTADPVERMRLRIDLAKYFEGKKDLAAAANTLTLLYNDSPLVLGVIRARVDFDKRNKRDDDAIRTLTEAAAKARPDLAAQFRFEAARVATDASQIDEARTLLTGLLNADPWRADYLAQMAETYAAARDDAGFIRYARQEIDALKKAPLGADDRNTRIAALRRRLIATMARENDFQGALDQYIEVIDAYPDDQAVLREAALFAAAHGLQSPLVAFYAKTIAGAPRDWRWPIVLARIETALEDYPAALNAYDTAMKDRPDRADLVEARAALEVRLLRFDDAIASYTRLYGLTYNDPQWLNKVAELEARLGRKAEAITALERADTSAGGATVSSLFAIADALDSFHMYADAAGYADRGFALAGTDLWTKYPEDGASYARILAANRRDREVLALPRQNPDAARANAQQSAGAVIASLYTPQEKAALAAQMNGLPVTTDGGLLGLARSAGLEDIVAQATHHVASQRQYNARQSERGLYESLSRELELVDDSLGAAQAARSEGDTAAEIRNYDYLRRTGRLTGPLAQRYFSLLAATDPAQLISLAGSGADALRNQAVQAAISAGNRNLTLEALHARASGLPPVWLSSLSAMTGVYFDDQSPAVSQAFLAALHPAMIGQRLAAKTDLNQSLAGSVWFYYGARYGEYLARRNAAAASDYLPAELEAAPGNPEAYLDLAGFYARRGQTANAIREFREALDLDADRGEAHNGIAAALMKDGKRPEAIAEWREAIAAFEREQGKGVRVRESFWPHVGAAIDSISQASALPDLRDNIHRLLADYVRINGGYRLNQLLAPALRASVRAGAGFDWLADVIQDAYIDVYQDFPDATAQQREQFDRFRLNLTLQQAAGANGAARTGLESQAIQQRAELINLLLADGKASEAETEWNQFSAADRDAHGQELTALEIRVAGAAGTVDQLIARYRATPDRAPAQRVLLEAATALRRDGQAPAAVTLLEYAYRRELDNQNLTMANFLGLSEVLLERGDTNQAVATLHRMILVATEEFNVENEPFEGYIPAADVLLRFHRNAEAAEFLAKAVQATPWDSEAKLKLAQIASGAERQRLAREIVADASAPYETRAEAARLLAPAQIDVPGELALLASGNVTATAAQKPFYVEAREAAAQATTDAALRLSLLREAVAIAPGNRVVRLDAVRAALGAGKDSLALAMFRYLSGNGVIAPVEEGDIGNQYADEIYPQLGFAPVMLGNGLNLTAADQMQLYEQLAGAAERTGNLAEAMGFLQNAQTPTIDAAERRRLAGKRQAIGSERQRLIDNAKRAPLITGKTEQAQIVRPRIVKETQ